MMSKTKMIRLMHPKTSKKEHLLKLPTKVKEMLR